MNSSDYAALQWVPVEQAFCSGKKLLGSDWSTPANQAYLFLNQDWDAKKAEFMVRTDSTLDSVIRVRALLFRGKHRQARADLDLLLKQSTERHAVAELLMDRARLLAFDGKWSESAALCDEAFSHAPSPITQLSLYQVRSLCLFEMGKMQEAARDLQELESYVHLFSEGCTPLYALCLKIKIIARDRSPVAARAQLKNLWRDLAFRERLNPDRVLSLLRTEIDLCRLEHKGHFSLAQASLSIARHMGDRLYAALAQLDCLLAAPDGLKSEFQHEVEEASTEFPRIGMICAALVDPDCTLAGTTILTLQDYFKKRTAAVDPVTSSHGAALEIQHLVLPERGVWISLTPWKVDSFAKDSQIQSFFRAVQSQAAESDVGMTKESLFRLLWGKSRYTAHLHDPVIHSLLYRVRKQFGADVSIRSDRLQMQGVLVT